MVGMGMKFFGPVDTMCTMLATLLSLILMLSALNWGSWSQSDILLNKVWDPADLTFAGQEYPEDCQGCYHVNKLTMRRSPNKWCIDIRQEVYLPTPPAPPPPIWRRLEEGDAAETSDAPLEGEIQSETLTETTETRYGETFKYKVWKNTTCVTDEWYMRQCSNQETMTYPELYDDCKPFQEAYDAVWNEDVPRECTEEIYKDKAAWGDCTPMVAPAEWCRLHLSWDDNVPTPPGDFYYHPDCECTCGTRCKEKVKNYCPKLWTSPAKYKLADCNKGKAICKGTADIYGATICACFFSFFALLVWMVAPFIKTRRTAKFLNGFAGVMMFLASLLSFGAIIGWLNFNFVLNEPRAVFLDALSRFMLLEIGPFDIYTDKTPHQFYTQYVRQNPWAFNVKSPSTPEYLEVDKQIEWNWSPDYLSVGWYCYLCGFGFQVLAIIFARFNHLIVRNPLAYEATKTMNNQDV